VDALSAYKPQSTPRTRSRHILCPCACCVNVNWVLAGAVYRESAKTGFHGSDTEDERVSEECLAASSTYFTNAWQ